MKEPSPGTVELEFAIGCDGKVRVVRGQPILTEGAVAVVQAWRHKPAWLNGAPTEVKAMVNVVFHPL